MLTQQELEDRKNFIGGSDAAIICGFSKYKTKIQLWMEKTGLAELEDISLKPQIQFGNYMEDGVAQWFEDNTGKKLHPKSKEKLIHPSHSWMAANLDRRLIDENAALECKTAGRPGEEWGDGENIIPTAYMLQCAHYCEVGNFDRIYICVVFSITREFRWYYYDRNESFQKKLITIESNFWFNHIVTSIAPEPSNKEEVLQFYKEINLEPIVGSDSIIADIYKLAETKSAIKILEKQEKSVMDSIAVFMGAHELIVDSTGHPLATWKFTKEVAKFNTDEFKKDYPDLYAKYVKIGNPQRRFNLKV